MKPGESIVERYLHTEIILSSTTTNIYSPIGLQ